MDNKEYYDKVSELNSRLHSWEKKVFDLALQIDDEHSVAEMKKVSNLLFLLWEAVVHYKGTLRELEKIEDERVKYYMEDKEERLAIIGIENDKSKI